MKLEHWLRSEFKQMPNLLCFDILLSKHICSLPVMIMILSLDNKHPGRPGGSYWPSASSNYRDGE